MNCPECNTKFQCPCYSCQNNFPNKNPWLREYIDGNNWFEICPKCGFKESVHWWYERQFDQKGEIMAKKAVAKPVMKPTSKPATKKSSKKGC